MRRVATLLVLLLPLLAAACGDDDGATGDGAGADGVLSLRVTFDEPLRVGPVTWTVTVVNGTDEAVELDFTDGQRADVALTQGGEDVYRWSRGLMFTQELGSEVVPPGGELSFPLDEPGLDVDAGDYTLTAEVTAVNRELRIERPVTVEPMRR